MHKFRAWDIERKEMINDPIFHEFTDINDHFDDEDYVFLQYTGLSDKNGVEIYCDDLVNVFFTSNEKEHIHDCIYKVSIDDLHGIKLSFVKLMWESNGYNQYPSATTLTSRYSNLDNDYQNQKYEELAVRDTWGENHLLQQKWKETDYSNYFEVIGNIHEELLENQQHP